MGMGMAALGEDEEERKRGGEEKREIKGDIELSLLVNYSRST